MGRTDRLRDSKGGRQVVRVDERRRRRCAKVSRERSSRLAATHAVTPTAAPTRTSSSPLSGIVFNGRRVPIRAEAPLTARKTTVTARSSATIKAMGGMTSRSQRLKPSIGAA